MFTRTSLPELIALIKVIIKSLKAFTASLWTLNTAVIAVKVAIGGALITVLLALGAAFLKAKAEGIGLDEVLMNLADDAGIIYNKTRHLQNAQDNLAQSSKRLATAMKAVDALVLLCWVTSLIFIYQLLTC